MQTDVTLSGVLTILSAMITPAVLISACASLTISTSNRLARAIDRTRRLSDQIRAHVQDAEPDGEAEQLVFLFDQLRRSVSRTRLLHRALTSLYAALGVFVATSIAIGVVFLSGERVPWLPPSLGMVGVGLLLYASALLIAETWIARRSLDMELAMILRLGERYLPADALKKLGSQAKTG